MLRFDDPMRKQSGSRSDPAREMVDIAQADLSIEEYLKELMGIVDRVLGLDSAVAARPELGTRVVARNVEGKNLELAERALEFARTRYAKEVLPAFRESARVGACIDSDFFPTERSKRESLLHREVVGPTGVRSMLQLCARWHGRPLLRLNLNRHGNPPFRRSDLERALRLLPTLEASVAARLLAPPNSSIDRLTDREREVAELAARGLTNTQIGLALGTSRYTVRNQLTRIYEKLEIESRAELAAYVSRAPQAQSDPW